MNKSDILHSIKNRFRSLYGDLLYEIVLFGSQVRGDNEEGSDFDVLVVLKGEINPFAEIARTENIVAELSLEFNIVIACVFTSKGRFENYKSPLFLNIHREGKSI